MNKKIVLILGITMTMLFTGCGTSKNTDTETKNVYQTSIKLSNEMIDATKEKYNISTPAFVVSTNDMNTQDAMWFNKEVREHSETDTIDGEYPVIEHIGSYINLKTGKEETIKDSDTEQSQTVNFKDTFGFDYKTCDGIFDIYNNILKSEGINIDFDNATFDEDRFKTFNESSYVLNNSDEIAKEIMKDEDYDEIVSANVSFFTDNVPEERIWYIDKVTATIVYKKDGIEYTKAIKYTLFFGNSKSVDATYKSSGNGCGCGSDSDCNTGENNGKSCESNCSMEDPIK